VPAGPDVAASRIDAAVTERATPERSRRAASTVGLSAMPAHVSAGPARIGAVTEVAGPVHMQVPARMSHRPLPHADGVPEAAGIAGTVRIAALLTRIVADRGLRCPIRSDPPVGNATLPENRAAESRHWHDRGRGVRKSLLGPRSRLPRRDAELQH
jgi:hypothetical protein